MVSEPGAQPRRRVLVVCPGRGSYERSSLGSLRGRSAAASAVIAACDAHRASVGRPTVSDLDASEVFRASLHVAGEHASLLTFACSLADLADLDLERFEVVGVIGNSMGWYTALAAAGALPLSDAIELVETMAGYQAPGSVGIVGGQVLYPVTDADWRADPALEAAVEEALAAVCAEGSVAEWSIRLGGYAVLGGDAEGVKRLLSSLPPVERGDRRYPVQLPLHSAFHTSLMQGTSERAQRDLAHLRLRPPAVALVDGRGAVHRPWSADPRVLREYTLGHQVVRPYDFTTSVVAALHHTGADLVVTLGPGNALGGPVARTLTAAGWGGARTRAAFEAANREQASLLSFGVTLQRRLLVRG